GAETLPGGTTQERLDLLDRAYRRRLRRLARVRARPVPRIRNVHDVRVELWLERRAEVTAPGQRERAVAEPVGAAGESDRPGAAGGQGSRLDRRLDRVAAGKAENRHREIAWRDPAEALRQLHLERARVDVAHAVDEERRLSRQSLDRGGVRMPEARHPEGGDE